MPSVPSATQGRIINQIYWTTGHPTRSKAFDHGIEATIGGGAQGDLLMITGPFGLRFQGRLLPRIETGELASYDPPTANRVAGWLSLAPRIGDDIFLKLYTHGAREDNADALLGSTTQNSGLLSMYRAIHEAAARRNIAVHWASAFDMFRAVDSLTHPTSTQPAAAPAAAIGTGAAAR